MEAEERRRLREKIYLLSDQELYRAAVDFIAEQDTVDGQSQMTSLLSYTQSWSDLYDFVKHQSQRDWIGKQAYYRQFYGALLSQLQQLRERVSKEWFPPPEEATKNETRLWVDERAILVTREFVQHLAAENLYREKVRK